MTIMTIHLPRWRNGIRGSLKNYWSQGLEGSSPSPGTRLHSAISFLTPLTFLHTLSVMDIKIKESILFGWEELKKQFWLILGVTVASIAFPSIIQNIGSDANGNPNLFFSLISFLVGVLFTAGVTRMVLNIVEKKKIEFSLLWSEHKHYVNLLFATILNSLAVALSFIALTLPGFLIGLSMNAFKYTLSPIASITMVLVTFLLITPGIIVGLRLSMFKYYVIEKNMSPVDSLKASWELTRGKTFDLFLFALARLGVVILGLLVFLVGVLVAVPVVEIAKAKVYKDLSRKE